MQTVSIEDRQVLARSPEGQTMALEVARLVELMSHQSLDTVYPDGLKAELREGRATIWVHQSAPRVHFFKWIAADSPAHYGSDTTYRDVSIALPYVIVFAVYQADRLGRLQLSGFNECFFRNEPLRSLDDPLFYPALLNCSKFDPTEPDRPLSWICTQHMRPRSARTMKSDNERLHTGLRELLACLFETGFNYSSEHHEVSSWFSESRGVDVRVSTVENWEAATLEKPTFVLDVPWLAVGKSVKEVGAHILARVARGCPKVSSAEDIARLVFNHGHGGK